jgi:hypothetical protein
MRWVYDSRTDRGERQTDTVEVTTDTKVLIGVTTVVVHDVATAGGATIEDTLDYFAQDAEGNVWYFGEDTTAFEGKKASTAGSWRAGVGGALPGIVMPAHPAAGTPGYRQEFDRGNAEDMGQIAATGRSAHTPFGDLTNVVVTNDWSPLEPTTFEQKFYAPNIGLVAEATSGDQTETIELIEFSR